MSEEEALAFLGEQRVVTCATHGPRGWPHLMPLWYLVREGEIWAWTYGRSQKVVNLEREPRATLQVEAGTEYQELRGVMLECEAVIHRDTPVVQAFGEDLFERYAGNRASEMVAAQAPKRVVLQFVERRRATWDHRKLGGVY
ncbi:MAG: pyridoxamine 5-phosphate oxidase [Solirubrobacteraceae bacterium]|nr:pyridoxamine 5-phosphate oxidase [Solirubrobacteraceae bacterium]